MIDKDKQYRTRDGREARIYATDGYTDYPVHGAVKQEEVWMPLQWRKEGFWHPTSRELDLVEVKPRIKRTMWVNVYPESVSLKIMSVSWPSKERADNQAMSNRIACAKVEIDCEEGEGL